MKHPVNQIDDLLGIEPIHFGSGLTITGAPLCGALEAKKFTKFAKSLTCYACMEALLQKTEQDLVTSVSDMTSRQAVEHRRDMLRKRLRKSGVD